MFSTNDLVAMRNQAAELMPGSATILTRTVASDGGGGQTEAFATGATVGCRLAPVGGGERQLVSGSASGARIDDRTTHILTLPYETEISTADRVQVSDVTYEVTLVRRRDVWEVARRVEVREVQD